MIVRPAVEKLDSTASNGLDHELPPIEAYAVDPEVTSIPPPASISIKSSIGLRIRTAAEVAETLPGTRWRLRPFIEDDAIVILYGD